MKRIVLSLMVLFLSVNAEEIYASFSVNAEKTADLAFSSSGIIDTVLVDVSSVVKKGEKLVALQNDDLRATLQVAKSSLQNAEVMLKYAQKDYERQVKIKDIIDEAKFDQYALAYEKAKAAVAQAKANLAYQQTLFDKTAIYAPFEGVIFEKSVEVGDVVSGMMLRTIFKIQSIKERKLVLAFDQKYWTKVKAGQAFKYTVDGDTQVYKGVISKVYPHANADNRKIKAEVKAQGFVVGLFGEGYIEIPEVK